MPTFTIGDTKTARITIKNTGTVRADLNITFRLRDIFGGYPISTWTLLSLNAGQTGSADFVVNFSGMAEGIYAPEVSVYHWDPVTGELLELLAFAEGEAVTLVPPAVVSVQIVSIVWL